MKQIKIIGQSINWMTSSFTRFLPKTLQAKTPIRAAKVGIWNVTLVSSSLFLILDPFNAMAAQMVALDETC